MKLKGKEISLNIIYEDNHILAVEKKADLLTQSDNNLKNLQDLAKNYLKKKLNKKNVFLHPIYRLDKQVEGIVVFAKTSKALSRLNKEMREKKIKKKYLAIIEGYLEDKKGKLENHLVHGSHRALVVKATAKKAKKAILTYKVLGEKNNTSLVEIELITGRYHQIRAQFGYINHPIVGDKKYGSKKDLKKIKLQCFYIELIHPTLKKILKFRVAKPTTWN